MREIGGYIELETYKLPMLHEGTIALNCGRNALAYICEAKGIERLYLPYFLCDSVSNVVKKLNIEIVYYHIDVNFLPLIDVNLKNNEYIYIYIVNYYGQLTNSVLFRMKEKYKNLIIDNAQAYFQLPLANTDVIYTCRKFFDVPDGAFLYTDTKIMQDLELDYSHARMKFLLGRYEKTASEFYREYVLNNKLFANEPIKLMSKLTNNLLHGIDYEYVKNRRTQNYNFLYDKLEEVNKLNLKRIEGAYAYPLYIENGFEMRKWLIQNKIYIPTLWPNVITEKLEGTVEYALAMNILPLPCDQRYDEQDMQYILKILNCNI